MINGDLFKMRLHPFLDGELGGEDAAQMEEYLTANPDENKSIAEYRDILSGLSLLADVPLPDGFHYKAMAKIRAGERRSRGRVMLWRSVLTAAAAFVVLCAGTIAFERYMPQSMRTVLDNNAETQIAADSGGSVYGIEDDTYMLDYAEPQDEYIMYEPEYGMEEMAESESDYASSQAAKGAVDYQAKIMSSPLNTDTTPETGEFSGQDLAQQQGLKIIRTAEVSIQTRDFDRLLEQLGQDISQVMGYYESSVISGDPAKPDGYGNRTANLSIRIPRESFEQFIARIKTVDGIGYISENNRDITSQYIDTQTRLETLHNQYARLEELNQKAATVTQMIEIEREMQNVLYSIESYTGDLKYWDTQVDYSTINVSIIELSPADRIAPTSESLGDRMIAAFYRTVNGFVAFLENSVVWLVSILPVLVVVVPVLLVVLISVLSARRHRKRAKPVDSE